jgi:hypothetical protein
MVNVLLCQTDDCRRNFKNLASTLEAEVFWVQASGEERRVGLAWWGQMQGPHGLFMYATVATS